MRETALVTGASGGIGEDLARVIAAGGRNVVLVARIADKLQALATQLSTAHRIEATVAAADLGRRRRSSVRSARAASPSTFSSTTPASAPPARSRRTNPTSSSACCR